MKYSSSSCASVNDKETDIRNKRERFNYKTIFFDGTLQNNFFHLFDLVIKNDFFNLGRRGGGGGSRVCNCKSACKLYFST